MELVPIDNSIKLQWGKFIDQNNEATFYHNYSWFRIMERIFGYRQRGFALLDGDCIVGGLPLFEINRIYQKCLVSSPFRDRGGLITKPGIDSSLLINEAIRIGANSQFDYVLIKNGNSIIPAAKKNFALHESKFWITTRTDLSSGAVAIWKKLKNNAQGPVKQAKKIGVVVSQGKSEKDIHSFYWIFLRTRHKLGVPCFSKKFFLALWEKFCLPGKAVLFLAKYKERTIAGIILLLHKDTVIDGYAASLPEFVQIRPNDLLVWHAIEWASAAGFKVFDFGADSPHQEGLLAYKRKWNGEQETLTNYYSMAKDAPVPNWDSSSPKYDIPKKAISRMPLPIFRLFSKVVISRLG
jgi:hypothetical protein